MLKTTQAYFAILAVALYIASGVVYEVMAKYEYPVIWRFNPDVPTMVFWLLDATAYFLFMFIGYKAVLSEKSIKHNDIIAKFILAFAYAVLLQEIIAQFFMYGESENDFFTIAIAAIYAMYHIWKRKKKEEKQLTG